MKQLTNWIKNIWTRTPAQPAENAVLIDPLQITAMWVGPNGDCYVQAYGMLLRRHEPLPVPDDMPRDGKHYVAYTWLRVGSLPSGCTVISDGPIAQQMSDEEISKLSPEQKAEFGL